MALRDVLVGFGIEIQGLDKIVELDNGIQKTIRGAQMLASALAGISIAKVAAGFITDTVEMGAKIVDMSNRLGVSTDDLQQFQYATAMVGVDANQAAKSLQFLERHVGLAADGSKAAVKDFAGLGVAVKDSAGNTRPLTELLPEVADAFGKMPDDAKRAEYAVKLFSRTGYGLLPLLRQGKEGLRGFYEEFDKLGLGLQSDFLKQAKEADQALTRLDYKWKVLKSRAVISLIPGLETGLDGLMKLFGYMSQFADQTNVAQTALIALGGAALAALSPLLIAIAPVVAEFTALYLLFDDIFTFLTGGDSVIGRTLDKLFGKGTGDNVAAQIKKDVVDLWDTFKQSLPTLKEFGDSLKGAFEYARPAFEVLFRGLGSFLELLVGGVKALIEMKNAVATGDWSAVGKAIDKAGDAVFGKGGTLSKYITFDPSNNTLDYTPNGGLPILGPHSQVAELPKGFIGPPAPEIGPPAPVTIEQHNETHITVQGAKTNEETGRAVAAAAKDGQDASHREAAAALKGRMR